MFGPMMELYYTLKVIGILAVLGFLGLMLMIIAIAWLIDLYRENKGDNNGQCD